MKQGAKNTQINIDAESENIMQRVWAFSSLCIGLSRFVAECNRCPRNFTTATVKTIMAKERSNALDGTCLKLYF